MYVYICSRRAANVIDARVQFLAEELLLQDDRLAEICNKLAGCIRTLMREGWLIVDLHHTKWSPDKF